MLAFMRIKQVATHTFPRKPIINDNVSVALVEINQLTAWKMVLFRFVFSLFFRLFVDFR